GQEGAPPRWQPRVSDSPQLPGLDNWTHDAKIPHSMASFVTCAVLAFRKGFADMTRPKPRSKKNRRPESSLASDLSRFGFEIRGDIVVPSRSVLVLMSQAVCWSTKRYLPAWKQVMVKLDIQ